MAALKATTPRAEQPGHDTEINQRQTTDVPNGISVGLVGEGVEADLRLFLKAEEVQENPADEGGEEGPGNWEGRPVDGAELLADIERFAGRFLAFPTKHHLVVLCLWAVHTWAVSAFYVTPRLVLDSPEPGSGKTRVLEILALLCHDAKLTLSTTTPALYRRIKSAEDKPPTILQDECDAVFGRTNNLQAEDLRALFNAGYKTGATVDRCEGNPRNMTVVDFPVFAPAALAGLISGPVAKHMRSVLDRAVVFHMRRRAPDEHVDEFRGRDAEAAAAQLRKRLRAWADDHFDVLAAARPRMPEGVRDRRAECWEALLAVAEAAGGDWPDRAREACRHFEFDTDPDDERLSLGMRLLRDIEAKFGARDRMHSADIVAELVSDPESEWGECGKPLDQRRLAKELKRYLVEPVDIRIGDVVRKGYMVDGDTGLGQAWRRWLSPAGKRNQRDNGEPPAQGVAECSAQNRERDERNTNATAELPPDQELFENVADVADVADTEGDPGLGPRQHANGERHPPAEDSETIEEWSAGLRDTLLADPAAHQQQTNGAGKPREPESDDGERKDHCLQCGSPLGSTGKCVPCIVNRIAART
jgi:hypothetical protein